MVADSYAMLFNIVKILLVLHGQASVERGFPVNKEVEFEKLNEQPLVADRILCDKNRTVGGVLNVSITKNLLISAVMSSQRCEKYLQDERDKKKTDEKTRKRKHVLDEIEELKEKRMKKETHALFKSTDDISVKGEETGQLTLVARSYVMRKAAREKNLELQQRNERLTVKLDALRDC